MVTKEIKRQRGAVTKFGKKCRRQNSVKRAEDRRRFSGQSRDEWRNTVFGGKKGAGTNINPARLVQFVVKKENVLNFHERRKFWALSFGKHGYPKTLSQTNLIIFSTFTTRQTHTQHQLETARKITSVSLTNIVGLLDKYLRKRLPTFALSKYCSDTKPTSLFIHRCPGLK